METVAIPNKLPFRDVWLCMGFHAKRHGNHATNQQHRFSHGRCLLDCSLEFDSVEVHLII